MYHATLMFENLFALAVMAFCHVIFTHELEFTVHTRHTVKLGILQKNSFLKYKLEYVSHLWLRESLYWAVPVNFMTTHKLVSPLAAFLEW